MREIDRLGTVHQIIPDWQGGYVLFDLIRSLVGADLAEPQIDSTWCPQSTRSGSRVVGILYTFRVANLVEIGVFGPESWVGAAAS
jgi:hypothetical protein